MNLDCQHIIHPFQEDPGVSQRERSRKILVTDPPKIDGRTLADLLDYFMELSPHVNYYDSQLNTSDWQPFFKKSKPFILAGMVKFDTAARAAKLDRYLKLFNKKPSKQSLQLIISFIYNNYIRRIITWYNELKGDELPVSATMESLIRRTLGEAFRQFMEIHDDAVKRYCIQRLDLSGITAIIPSQVRKPGTEFKWNKGRTRRERMILMRDELLSLNQANIYAHQIIAGSARKSIGRSLLPLQAELQKKHLPHLGLLFAFLKLFRYLQKDLNSITRKQLDHFYKEVLKIKPADAVADKTHIIFEIQKQLKKYMLKKGLLAKDGKDNNKAEIYFSLEDDIVVNKAQVADQRALHLDFGYAHDYRYLKGLNIANDLTMADGVDKPFPDGQPKNYPTTGAALSKYIIPGTSLFKPYPKARVGFVLASPVLLLSEGNRTVDIHINCFLNEQLCDDQKPVAEQKNACCEDHEGAARSIKLPLCNSGIYSSGMFLLKVREMLTQQFYYISQPLIQEALKNGITKDVSANLLNFLLAPENKLCYCPVEQHYFDRSVEAVKFRSYFSTDELTSLLPWFSPRRILQVSFSGEKEWIVPAKDELTIELTDNAMGFDLHIQATFDPKVSAITYFDSKALKEKLDTRLPVVKVMLDDSIKMYFDDNQLEDFARLEKIKKEREEPDCCPDNSNCCVRRNDPSVEHEVSLYHFFRNLVVNNTENTRIDVKVCGLKNLIVQNDDSVQDVNAPIFPFGTRPKIIDFDVIDPPKPPLGFPNLVGPNFYLGSKEIFLKKWTNLCVNFAWKDKPSNFNEHYKAYLKRENYHDCATPLQNNKSIYGLNECDFKVMLALLDDGKWEEEASKRNLFNKGFCNAVCQHNPQTGYYSFHILPAGFNVIPEFIQMDEDLVKYDIKSRYGFVRINLRDQDFLHKDYAFVLARQMMALSMFDGKKTLEGAVYLLNGNTVIVFKNTGQIIIDIQNLILDVKNKTLSADGDVNNIINAIPGIIDITDPAAIINLFEYINILLPLLNNADNTTTLAKDAAALLFANLNLLKDIISIFKPGTDEFKDELSVPIPNEPWTPVMENLSVDYKASADINDIQIIHLYPFKDTYKKEEIKQLPTLFPLHCNEGSLFIGISDLEPGSNLNILFQLAEATADTEADKADVQWHYLSNNQWKSLRPGFEVLDDKTVGLTASGIVKFATPEDMTNEDTIMTSDKGKELYWIKASVPENSRAICETIGIHAQAILATFTNEDINDKQRLSQPLPAGSIAKLQVADANVKKTEQLYESTGGRAPEKLGHYYIRVSELLRHKGRAIQKFDYERIILEAFPQVYRTKCIPHSFALDARKYITDFPIAPGYVTVAVIPDLNKIKAGKMFEPGLATAVLENIAALVKEKTSPFVRVRIMNPRYEKINICLKVKLVRGKDEKFFKEKMEQDIRTFLAPWAVGEYSKLKFGQCINHSDLVGFLESMDYLDFILDLQWGHESDWDNALTDDEKRQPDICPKAARSILIGGSIDICCLSKDCTE